MKLWKTLNFTSYVYLQSSFLPKNVPSNYNVFSRMSAGLLQKAKGTDIILNININQWGVLKWFSQRQTWNTGITCQTDTPGKRLAAHGSKNSHKDLPAGLHADREKRRCDWQLICWNISHFVIVLTFPLLLWHADMRALSVSFRSLRSSFIAVRKSMHDVRAEQNWGVWVSVGVWQLAALHNAVTQISDILNSLHLLARRWVLEQQPRHEHVSRTARRALWAGCLNQLKAVIINERLLINHSASHYI